MKISGIDSVVFYNLATNKEILTLNTFDTVPITTIGNYKPKPRVFALKNIEGNKDLFEGSLPYIGKTLRVESDIANGLFKLSLENDELVFTEQLQ